METDEALDIVMNHALCRNIPGPEEAERLTEALDILHFARPFLATALKLAWQGAEPKPVRDRRRALDLGGRNEHAGP